jgi:hypothetical protein
MPTWTRDYKGFETFPDFIFDGHWEDALRQIVPDGEYKGTVRVTLEYIGEPDGQDEVVDAIALLLGEEAIPRIRANIKRRNDGR